MLDSPRPRITGWDRHHWASADPIDLEAVIPAVRAVGARIVLDLTQTIGATPVDIGRLAPDFMVTAAYKWRPIRACGPVGAGNCVVPGHRAWVCRGWR